MKDYIAEMLKLNPQATAQWGATRLTASVWGLPFKEGVIIDVHGANQQDIKIPEDCVFDPTDCYEGVEALVWKPEDKGVAYYIKGINPKSRVEWMEKQHAFATHSV